MWLNPDFQECGPWNSTPTPGGLVNISLLLFERGAVSGIPLRILGTGPCTRASAPVSHPEDGHARRANPTPSPTRQTADTTLLRTTTLLNKLQIQTMPALHTRRHATPTYQWPTPTSNASAYAHTQPHVRDRARHRCRRAPRRRVPRPGPPSHAYSRSPATAAVLIKKLAEAREAMPRPVYVGPWPWTFTTVFDDISGYALRPLVARGVRSLWAPARRAQEDAPPRP